MYLQGRVWFKPLDTNWTSKSLTLHTHWHLLRATSLWSQPYGKYVEWKFFVVASSFYRIHCWLKVHKGLKHETGHLWNQLILFTICHSQEWTSFLICLVSLLGVYMKNIFYLKYVWSLSCSFYQVNHRWLIINRKGTNISDWNGLFMCV